MAEKKGDREMTAEGATERPTEGGLLSQLVGHNERVWEWRAAAQAHAEQLGLVAGESLWDADDVFDLADDAREAYAAGKDPKAFVEEVFAEDLTRMGRDEAMAAAHAGEDEDEDEPEAAKVAPERPKRVRGERKGGRYVEVPLKAIAAKLVEAKFERVPGEGEVTYLRRHDKRGALIVVVYTSVAEEGSVARGRGEDAIRVLAFFTWTRRGEEKVRRKKLYGARVFRVTSVEGVLGRMMERAREAYAACNKWLTEDAQRASRAEGGGPRGGGRWR